MVDFKESLKVTPDKIDKKAEIIKHGWNTKTTSKSKIQIALEQLGSTSIHL